VSQSKEEKKKENEAVNRHRDDVNGYFISHNSRRKSIVWLGSEEVLKSEIICCILKFRILGRRLAMACI